MVFKVISNWSSLRRGLRIPGQSYSNNSLLPFFQTQNTRRINAPLAKRFDIWAASSISWLNGFSGAWSADSVAARVTCSHHFHESTTRRCAGLVLCLDGVHTFHAPHSLSISPPTSATTPASGLPVPRPVWFALSRHLPVTAKTVFPESCAPWLAQCQRLLRQPVSVPACILLKVLAGSRSLRKSVRATIRSCRPTWRGLWW